MRHFHSVAFAFSLLSISHQSASGCVLVDAWPRWDEIPLFCHQVLCRRYGAAGSRW
jgi:hypothetical protein